MYINTDDKVHRKLIEDMASGKKKDGKKLQNDKRITSVGKILRKYSTFSKNGGKFVSIYPSSKYAMNIK